MPKVTEQLPEGLRAYNFHSLELRINGDNGVADCPFCGGSEKFAINISNGMYRCYVCGGPSGKGGGNVYTFIRELHAKSLEVMDWDELEPFAIERNTPASELKEWGIVKSAIDGQWLLPGYTYKNGMNNLYKYGQVKGGKHRWMGTSTLDHCLFGIQFWDDAKRDVIVCEGPGDGAILRYALKKSKKTEEGSVVRAFGNVNLLSRYNVVATPGCETFKEAWVGPFQGKNVYLPYDSDYPKKDKEGKLRLKAGRLIVPGYDGMKLAAKMLKPVANEIYIANWGVEGFNPNLPDGFDVKDCLTTDTVLGLGEQKDAVSTN